MIRRRYGMPQTSNLDGVLFNILTDVCCTSCRHPTRHAGGDRSTALTDTDTYGSGARQSDPTRPSPLGRPTTRAVISDGRNDFHHVRVMVGEPPIPDCDAGLLHRQHPPRPRNRDVVDAAQPIPLMGQLGRRHLQAQLLERVLDGRAASQAASPFPAHQRMVPVPSPHPVGRQARTPGPVGVAPAPPRLTGPATGPRQDRRAEHPPGDPCGSAGRMRLRQRQACYGSDGLVRRLSAEAATDRCCRRRLKDLGCADCRPRPTPASTERRRLRSGSFEPCLQGLVRSVQACWLSSY